MDAEKTFLKNRYQTVQALQLSGLRRHFCLKIFAFLYEFSSKILIYGHIFVRPDFFFVNSDKTIAAVRNHLKSLMQLAEMHGIVQSN